MEREKMREELKREERTESERERDKATERDSERETARETVRDRERERVCVCRKNGSTQRAPPPQIQTLDVHVLQFKQEVTSAGSGYS